MSDKYRLTSHQRRQLVASPAGWIASGFCSGLFPRMPGTVGSLVALIPWWFLFRGMPLPFYAAIVIVSLVLGVWACEKSSRLLGVADHRALVWDEFVGQWIALLPVLTGSWLMMALGFVLFRTFDIAKPWPISWFDESVKGGLGVMLDDVIAGIFAAICLFALQMIRF